MAPYEADAQLAYLTKSGLAQAVITEDSDLLAFGCKKVLYPIQTLPFYLEKKLSTLCHNLRHINHYEPLRVVCFSQSFR